MNPDLPDHGPSPRISVGVPTRDRGVAIIPTLRSLANLDHDRYEVIVVDQSSDGLSSGAFHATVGADPRFRHISSESVGVSASRNLALAHARAPLIAFTDDDCIVPPEWLSDLEEKFAKNPKLGMVCAAIVPGIHHDASEFTPSFTPTREHTFRSRWLVRGAMSAGGGNLAFRSEALREVGGFDEVLGAGAPLRGSEEFDALYRLLTRGYRSLVTPHPVVVHNERRPWSVDGVKLLRGYAFSEGAQVMKHIRCGDSAALLCLVELWLGKLRWRRLLRLQRGSGVGNFVALAKGAVSSFKYPIDPARRVYRPLAPPGMRPRRSHREERHSQIG